MYGPCCHGVVYILYRTIITQIMHEIKRRRGESIERLMARFKKECSISGLNHDIKRKRHHLKPSEIKNRKKTDIKFLAKKRKKREIQLKLKKNVIKRRGTYPKKKRL